MRGGRGRSRESWFRGPGTASAGTRPRSRARSSAGSGGGGSGERRRAGSEPGSLLHELPVRVLVEDLVAAELVDVAALIVEPLPVGTGAGHHPDRDRPVAGHEVVDVVPAHVADDLEPVREHLADGGLALHPAAARLGPAGHEEGGVVGEEGEDAAHVAAVEGRVDLEEQVDAGAAGGRGLGHGRHSARARGRGQAPPARAVWRPTKSSTWATHLSVAGLSCWAKPWRDSGKWTCSTLPPAPRYASTKARVIVAGTLSSRSGWAIHAGGSAVARPSATIRVTLAPAIAASSAKNARCEAISRLA